MSLVSMIGPRPNLLGHEAGKPLPARSDAADPDRRRSAKDPRDRDAGARLPHRHARRHLARGGGREGLASALERLCREATEAVAAGHNILILSDRATAEERVPIPVLLATSAVHHHLILEGLRTSTGIVVETGEAREVHHFCALAGYGAEAINPYLAFATLEAIGSKTGCRSAPKRCARII